MAASVMIRMDAELCAIAEKLANETGVTTREVLERCIRVGLVQDKEFANSGPMALEVLHLLSKPLFRGVVEAILGEKVDPVQMKRVEHKREKLRAGRRVVPG
mgnify:CR=1 FL=1